MTENKVGGYEGIQSGLQQTHIIIVIVIASAARQSITALITTSSRSLDRRVAQVLLAMTENKVGGYEGIRSGLQQIHIIVIIVIVIASAARQSIAAHITSSSSLRAQRGNLLRPTLPRHRHCERSAAIYYGPHYLQLTKPRSQRRTSAPRDDGE